MFNILIKEAYGTCMLDYVPVICSLQLIHVKEYMVSD